MSRGMPAVGQGAEHPATSAQLDAATDAVRSFALAIASGYSDNQFYAAELLVFAAATMAVEWYDALDTDEGRRAIVEAVEGFGVAAMATFLANCPTAAAFTTN